MAVLQKFSIIRGFCHHYTDHNSLNVLEYYNNNDDDNDDDDNSVADNDANEKKDTYILL